MAAQTLGFALKMRSDDGNIKVWLCEEDGEPESGRLVMTVDQDLIDETDSKEDLVHLLQVLSTRLGSLLTGHPESALTTELRGPGAPN